MEFEGNDILNILFSKNFLEGGEGCANRVLEDSLPHTFFFFVMVSHSI